MIRFLAIGATGVILIGGAGLLGFLLLVEPGSIVSLAEVSVVLWMGRLALVGAVLGDALPWATGQRNLSLKRPASPLAGKRATL